MILYSHRQGEYWQSRTHSQPISFLLDFIRTVSEHLLLLCYSVCLSVWFRVSLPSLGLIQVWHPHLLNHKQYLCVFVWSCRDRWWIWSCTSCSLHISDPDRTVTQSHWWFLFVCVCLLFPIFHQSFFFSWQEWASIIWSPVGLMERKKPCMTDFVLSNC